MRKHANAISEYSRIKIEAANLYSDDIDKYIEHKSPVIEKIYEEMNLKDKKHTDEINL